MGTGNFEDESAVSASQVFLKSLPCSAGHVPSYFCSVPWGFGPSRGDGERSVWSTFRFGEGDSIQTMSTGILPFSFRNFAPVYPRLGSTGSCMVGAAKDCGIVFDITASTNQFAGLGPEASVTKLKVPVPSDLGNNSSHMSRFERTSSLRVEQPQPLCVSTAMEPATVVAMGDSLNGIHLYDLGHSGSSTLHPFQTLHVGSPVSSVTWLDSPGVLAAGTSQKCNLLSRLRWTENTGCAHALLFRNFESCRCSSVTANLSGT